MQAQDTQALARLYCLQCADWQSDLLTRWERTHPEDFTAALAFLSSPRPSAPLQPSQALALVALGLQPVAGVLDGLQDISAEISPMDNGSLVLQALLLESFTHLRVDEAWRLVRFLGGLQEGNRK